jgi:tetratricopeptide (TPR) repeat protein
VEDRPGLTLHFTGTLLQYEVSWIHYREALSWLEPAIEQARKLLEDNPTEINMTDFIRALNSLGWLLVTHGDMIKGLSILDESIQLAHNSNEIRLLAFALSMKIQAMGSNVTWEIIYQLEEIIEICRQSNYELELVTALFSVGQAYFVKGDSEKGERNIAEVIELVEKLDVPYIKAWVYYVKAIEARMAHKSSAAERYYLLVIEGNEKLGNQRLTATGRSDLAHLYRQEGRLDEAMAIYRQTILSWQEQGHQAAVAHQLECFAYIAIRRERFDYAAQLLGAAQIARERTNSPSTEQQEISEKEQAVSELEMEIGEKELDRLLEKGRLMSLDEAVAFALEQDQDEVGPELVR